MQNNIDVLAHYANCDSLIKLAEKLMVGQTKEKQDLIRVIEAYRQRPDLLQYIEQLEGSIFSLIRTYFGEESETSIKIPLRSVN